MYKQPAMLGRTLRLYYLFINNFETDTDRALTLWIYIYVYIYMYIKITLLAFSCLILNKQGPHLQVWQKMVAKDETATIFGVAIEDFVRNAFLKKN